MNTFTKAIWDTLSCIDVSEHIEKKGGLSYLSWANAWTYLMNAYPASSFTFLDNKTFPGGSVEVCVEVTVTDDGKSFISRTMTLPVMDYKNKAIPDPTSRDISDARMRCLVKCIALFGLGLSLYRGEDIPEQREPAQRAAPKQKAAPATEAQYAEINAFVKKKQIPVRTLEWLKDEKNWEGMTSKQADNIISICKEHKS